MSAPHQSDEIVSPECLSFAAAEIKGLYGSAASGSVHWQFTPNPTRYSWRDVNVLADGRFDASRARLVDRREEAIDDAGGLAALVANGKLHPRSCDLLAAGLDRQAEHAGHLVQAIDGSHDQPWCTERTPQASPSSLGDFLLVLYGKDPRPTFLDAMAGKGIIPMDPTQISAGARLHVFPTITDQDGEANGWAVLHRCPPAGSFGSFATGVVHRWAANADDLERFATQFAIDEARAAAFLDARRKAA